MSAKSGMTYPDPYLKFKESDSKETARDVYGIQVITLSDDIQLQANTVQALQAMANRLNTERPMMEQRLLSSLMREIVYIFKSDGHYQRARITVQLLDKYDQEGARNRYSGELPIDVVYNRQANLLTVTFRINNEDGINELCIN